MIDGFALGPLYIRFYGIILMLGAVAGGYLATVEVKRRGQDPEMVWDLLVYLIIGGVVGARLWHVFTPPPSSIAEGFPVQYYLTHPLDALAIWKGGLGIPGAIIGGLIALLLYARGHKEIAFLDWTDIAAPGLALGQWFWLEGVAGLGAARAGLYLYLEPLATLALAVPLLGEPFGLSGALGGGLVLTGVYVGQRDRRVSPGAAT